MDSTATELSLPQDQLTCKKKEKKTWEKPYMLPPCKVCEGKGTGFHYGVNTCEPCKIFFKRSLAKHQEYKCRHDSRCRIGGGMRNMCTMCRYKKCLDVGMSREGIRNGRYTLTKINRDIKAVKEHQAQQALAVRLVKEEQYRPSVQKLVVQLSKASSKHKHIRIQFEEDSWKMMEKFMENFRIQKNMIDDLPSIENGDGRAQLWQDCLALGEKALRLTLKFVKLVPGFRELDISDQIELFQVVSTDVHQACGMGYWMSDEGTAKLDKMNPASLWGDEYGRLGKRLLLYWKDLNLTEEELALLGGMTIFQSDRCQLKNPRRVQELQEQMAAALHWLIRHNHPDEKHLFYKVISALTLWRSFDELQRNLMRCMFDLESKGVIGIPPLVKETVPQLE